MGAWIETCLTISFSHIRLVAPYMGAWIETLQTSLRIRTGCVAPYMGAWIETGLKPSSGSVCLLG